MSIIIRPSAARGHVQHGWLNSRHSFSFGHYYDAAQMGFRSLRVINEDIIDGGSGFPTHPHRDMEIISYVVSGALAHRDSTGSEGVIRRGEVQAMSAGTGVRHSEFNDLTDEKTRFLQIWIEPSTEGLPPSYGDKTISEESRHNRLALLAGPAGIDGALTINQDALLYGCLLDQGHAIRHGLAAGRGAWLQLVDGALTVNGTALLSGDGARIEDVAEVSVTADRNSEFLLFDLA